MLFRKIINDTKYFVFYLEILSCCIHYARARRYYQRLLLYSYFSQSKEKITTMTHLYFVLVQFTYRPYSFFFLSFTLFIRCYQIIILVIYFLPYFILTKKKDQFYSHQLFSASFLKTADAR